MTADTRADEISAPGPAASRPHLSAGLPPAAAAGAVPLQEPDALTVEVLTFGPGSHPFTKFGHNAIRLTDRGAGTDLVYNFGTFSFDSPWLIVDFLEGRLKYWLSRSSMAWTVRVYRREGRSIDVQTLALSLAQKRELARRLDINARPANREYRYDYFADNCSTRVRDALDGVLGGRLRMAAVGSGSMTLRSHALRMAADNIPLYLALLIALGPSTDRPVDEWAETFLPEMLQALLRKVTLGGQSVPAAALVQDERILSPTSRAPPARAAPNRVADLLGFGLFVGLGFSLLGWAAAHAALARVSFGVTVTAAGLVLGVIGCFLLGAWALTPHTVVYRNQNILLFAPFAIALAPMGVAVTLGRPAVVRKVHRLAVAGLALAVIAWMIKLAPIARQDNAALIALMVPIWIGIMVGARNAGRSGRPLRS